MNFKELPPVKEQIMKCVRCGKCRSVCPVFAEMKTEIVAPRGHVFMVQMLRDGVVKPTSEVSDHLTNCLMCETCSVNCPSGIDIHDLNAAARSYIYDHNKSLSKDFIFDTFWSKPSLLKNGIRLMSVAQKLGLQSLARKLRITKILPADLPKAEKIMTAVPIKSARSKLKTYNPAVGRKKFTIAYFLGCGTNFLNPSVALATVSVLTKNGCDVIIPEQQKCCGLPHIANGKIGVAQELMIDNFKVFNNIDCDYIITDCASCSSAIGEKNLEFLFHHSEHENAAKAMAAKVKDLNVFLVNDLDIKVPNNHKLDLKVTYHDPCHLANAQGITREPRELLNKIPGVEYVEMSLAQRCCGGSGTFSLTHYDLSMKILDKKMDSAAQTKAQVLATSCPSCMMQLRHGVERNNLNVKVMHPVELIDECY